MKPISLPPSISQPHPLLTIFRTCNATTSSSSSSTPSAQAHSASLVSLATSCPIWSSVVTKRCSRWPDCCCGPWPSPITPFCFCGSSSSPSTTSSSTQDSTKPLTLPPGSMSV